MSTRKCLKCYHSQGYDYCAIYDTLHDDCDSFIEEESVHFYFNGRASLTTRATSARGSAATPAANGKDKD